MASDTTDISALPINPNAGGVMAQNVKVHNPAQALAQQRDEQAQQMQAQQMQQQMQAQQAQQMQQQMQAQQMQAQQMQAQQMQAQQMQGQQMPGQPNPTNNINTLVSGLQEAAASGMTNLPARDIPRQTTQHMVDPETRVEHVPEHRDYITDHNNRQREAEKEIIRQENRQASVEVIHSELQAPVILAALFFIFQLPFLRKGIMKYIPGMLNEDGHYNIYGYLIVSLLFAATYYGIDKAVISLVVA